ncbi:hypothetical protein ACFV9E_03515 [Streptomyces sp. NPDC059835]|uniref:hypothetical protein n=1 Tax=Streptomyces sp. NPDC059835 TaxID=3346967 RepID=UPI00365D9DDC
MTLTSKDVQALHSGNVDHLVLADGRHFTRDDLTAYISALRIETDDTGVPLGRGWQVVARCLRGPAGAPDLAQLDEIRAAAKAIKDAERLRDSLIRRYAPNWTPDAIAYEARLSPQRIHQIRTTEPTEEEQQP